MDSETPVECSQTSDMIQDLKLKAHPELDQQSHPSLSVNPPEEMVDEQRQHIKETHQICC